MRSFVLLIVMATLFSCKKDTTTTKTPTKQELLEANKWEISSATSGIVDVYSQLPDYEKDDYIVFKSDKTYELNANTDKDPNNSNPILDTGTWELTNSDQTIVLHSNNTTTGSLITQLGDLQIKELTATTLSISGSYTYSGFPVTVVATFKPL